MMTLEISTPNPFEVLGEIVDAKFMPNRERMFRVGEYLINMVKTNFLAGGRPDRWKPSKKNPLTMIGSGALMNSGRISTLTDDTVRVTFGEGLPYARIHQTGGIIKHPGSKKFQVFEVGGQVVFTHGTKAHDIPMPKRRYVNIPPTEVAGIIRTYNTSTQGV